MMNRPDMAKAMSELYKQASKLDGMPVAAVIKMGGSVQGMPTSADQEQSAAQSSEQDTTAPPPTSVGSAVAGAMAGRFGFGRHKKQADSASSATAEPAASASKPQQDGTAQQASGSLIEMTSEVTSYNSGTVDPAVFQIPADFQKVEEDYTKARTRR
jgi:hypothetical protein